MARKPIDVRHTKPVFRGWTKPGPMPDVSQIHEVPLGPEETIDALCGHFRIFQLRHGHRYSTDDVLTAWYGTSWCPSARRVLDLGSGIGSVGMTAAWRLPLARFVTVEAQEVSVALARKSALYNGLLDRYDIRCGDFRDPGVLAPDETFDLVLGSPPYFPLEEGVTSDHPQKVACRFEVRGSIADYAQVAARHISPGGIFACVFPTRQAQHLERAQRAADDAGLVIVRRRPVALNATEEPLLSLFVMMRKQDLPASMHARTWVEPALVVRQADGSVHPEYDAVKLSFGFPPGG